MTTTLTSAAPTTPAAATSRLSLVLPIGSETRVIGGLYAAFQALLDLAALAAKLVTGGTIGDGTGSTVALANNVSCKSMTTVNDCTVGGDLHADSGECFFDTVHTGQITVNGAQVNGSTQETQSTISFSHSGRIVPRYADFATGATLDVRAAKYWRYPVGSPTGTATIGTTGCVEGDTLFIQTDEGTNVLTVNGGLAMRQGALVSKAQFRFTSGAWELYRFDA